MWKKITSFFFEEEEYEIEENTNAQEAYEIPELKPFKETKKEDSKPIINEKPTQVQFKEIETIPSETKESPKKKFGINLEEPVVTQAKETKTKESQREYYTMKEVISPISGGSQSNFEAKKQSKIELKSRKPITPIISPMYGKVNEDEKSTESTQDILDMKLDEIIKPEVNEEQISIIDFMEVNNDEE